ncbi:unnamed protein product [Ilex paraguariensis]|uniref:Uncharacterized protein n=1 Tax=Ilex paraguariensis TaxID=185542 RepID=A0ABC8T333_9AQUA
MAPSVDCAVSSLLCAEDNNSIFYDDDDVDIGVFEEFDDKWNNRNSRINNQNQSFIGDQCFTGLPIQSDECLAFMVKSECEHLPAIDYLKRLKNGDLNLGAREVAVDWIRKVVDGLTFNALAYFSFGPLCAYLSINYMDRFLSAYESPKWKAWMMQLLAVACLSLAAKMEETEVPLCLDLQVADSKFVFEARTIQRMELLVLSTLKWRMQAVTPFSFIDYFLRKINSDQTTSSSSFCRSTQLIMATINGIEFLEFKPSEIAAAVAISVSGETQTIDTEKALSALTHHAEEERVRKCVELLHELSLLSGCMKVLNASISSLPQSPIGVLDASFLSYKTDKTTVGSCASSSHNSPDAKRRKLNRPFEVEL